MGTVEMEADWLRIVSCQSQGDVGLTLLLSLRFHAFGVLPETILVLGGNARLYSGPQQHLAGKHERRFELCHVNLLLQFKTEIWSASVLP